MNVEALLETHAEVAVALAGFASVSAVLRRPLSALLRQRFLAILFAALVQVLGGLVPVWLSVLGVVGPTLWRTASFLQFALAATLVWTVVYVPLKSTSASAYVIINRPMSFVYYLIALCLLAAHLLNVLGMPMAPNFGLYYGALLAAITTLFLGFADVVLIGDREVD